jgi:hypothetical protein
MEDFTGDKSWEEWLGAEVFVVLLEVLLGGGHELDSDELEAKLSVSQLCYKYGQSCLTRGSRSGR